MESLPLALVGALRAYNSSHIREEQIRLRMALHAGEVTYDGHGVSGGALNFAFRILDAAQLRSALAASPGVLALVASSWFYEEVVRHSPASYPAGYSAVRVSVKKTTTTAWICLPDHHYCTRKPRAVLVALSGLVVAAVTVVVAVASSLGESSDAQGTSPNETVSAAPPALVPSSDPPTDETPPDTPPPTRPTGSTAGGRISPRSAATTPRRARPDTSPPTTAATSLPSGVAPTDPPVHVQRNVTLERYSWLDLDTTADSPPHGGDLYYGQDANSMEFSFQPMSESEIWPADGSSQELRACQDAGAPRDKITVDTLPDGSVVCVRTSDGRLSGVKVIRAVEGPAGRSYELNYLTWEHD